MAATPQKPNTTLVPPGMTATDFVQPTPTPWQHRELGSSQVNPPPSTSASPEPVWFREAELPFVDTMDHHPEPQRPKVVARPSTDAVVWFLSGMVMMTAVAALTLAALYVLSAPPPPVYSPGLITVESGP